MSDAGLGTLRPGGTDENSPALQCWVHGKRKRHMSPGGTTETAFSPGFNRPYGTPWPEPRGPDYFLATMSPKRPLVPWTRRCQPKGAFDMLRNNAFGKTEIAVPLCVLVLLVQLAQSAPHDTDRVEEAPGKRDADFSRFRSAEKLTFEDHGSDEDKTAKRSVTVSKRETVAEVYAVLQSVAANWTLERWTPPYPRFVLLSLKDDKVTDVIWLDAPGKTSGKSYFQMKSSSGSTYYRYISERDYRRLFKILGVAGWDKDPDSQNDGTKEQGGKGKRSGVPDFALRPKMGPSERDHGRDTSAARWVIASLAATAPSRQRAATPQPQVFRRRRRATGCKSISCRYRDSRPLEFAAPTWRTRDAALDIAPHST